jgi:hypothetical protein
VGDYRAQTTGANGFATENNRSARKAVSREERGRFTFDVTNKECEVTRSRLETNVATCAVKAARKSGGRVKVHGKSNGDGIARIAMVGRGARVNVRGWRREDRYADDARASAAGNRIT